MVIRLLRGARLPAGVPITQRASAPVHRRRIASLPVKAVAEATTTTTHVSETPAQPIGNLISPSRVSTVASLLSKALAPDAVETVTVNGWVRSNRNMKKYSFLNIGDGTTTQPIQAVIPKELFPDVKDLTTGTSIQITGEWRAAPGAKQAQQARELHYQSLTILGLSDPETYPLQKKYHSPEFLRTLPHMRSRLSSYTALLQLRSWVTARVTNFFVEKDFIQVHPPIITSSDCEGAGEVFSISTNPSSLQGAPPKEAQQPNDKDGQEHFFRTSKYLTVSSQLHLESFVHAVPRVWTLSPTFRAEKSDTNRHLSEFYMLEAEIAFTRELEDVMSLVEQLTRYVVSGMRDSRVGREIAQIYAARSEDEVAGDDMGRDSLEDRWESILSPEPWTRMTYTQAVEHLRAAVDANEVKFQFAPAWGNSLQAEHEKYLARRYGSGGKGGPVFVTDYPKAQKPFYMLPSPQSPQDTVACFDLLLPHVGELVGGSLREHGYQEIVDAMRKHGVLPPSPPPPSSSTDASSSTNNTTITPSPETHGTEASAVEEGMLWYADLRKWGSVTHGGFGMGYDRLLAYLAGVKDIREVVAFPRWSGRCDC
ncbi:hypothetical protein DFH27DRAFT_141104 [Peziza echinospora]|nr:hypothetical protein DFH27DRAFT_141104 [Peziza echinospora]